MWYAALYAAQHGVPIVPYFGSHGRTAELGLHTCPDLVTVSRLGLDLFPLSLGVMQPGPSPTAPVRLTTRLLHIQHFALPLPAASPPASGTGTCMMVQVCRWPTAPCFPWALQWFIIFINCPSLNSCCSLSSHFLLYSQLLIFFKLFVSRKYEVRNVRKSRDM